MVRHPEVTQLGDPRSIDDRVSLSMHLSNDPVDDAHEALLLARKKKRVSLQNFFWLVPPKITKKDKKQFVFLFV